jgi:site-specific DNA-adenine methylase
MRPFFSYYGSKWSIARKYGPPELEPIVEPFAGSASYSLYWNCTNVNLYDISDQICEIWDFLIRCSEADIRAIPDGFRSQDEFDLLTGPQRLLVGFWVAKGRAESSSVLSPWYYQYKHDKTCSVWGAPVKNRILDQKPYISKWSISKACWRDIPIDVPSHWFVDPPYCGKPGRRYPHSDIDYLELAEWCAELPGTVIVCENDGADWMDFEDIGDIVSTRGRRSGHRSREVACKIDNRSPSLEQPRRRGRG